MLRIVARLRARARAMPARSPFTSVTPALCDRDVGAGAHGDADVGFGQRRRVVHAVARHGDDAALGPELPDDAVLVLGQDIGLDLVDAELARRRPRPWCGCRRSA